MSTSRIHALALAALLAPTVPLPAQAEEWAEFSWNASRQGPGSITYRRDLLDAALNADGGVTLADSIASYSVTAWHLLSERHQFDGHGGSVTTRHVEQQCPDGGSPCLMPHIIFDLGPMSNGDPRPWQVDITLASYLRFEADGRLPYEVPLPEYPQGGWSAWEGYISNPVDGTRYMTLDLRNTVFHRAVAAPVPEPGAALLSVLGLLTVGHQARKRRRASGVGTAAQEQASRVVATAAPARHPAGSGLSFVSGVRPVNRCM